MVGHLDYSMWDIIWMGHDILSYLYHSADQICFGCAIPREDGRLDSGTIGNTLITVNVRVESLSLEGLGKDALNFGDFARSSNKYDLINVFRGKSGFFNASLNGSSNLLH